MTIGNHEYDFIHRLKINGFLYTIHDTHKKNTNTTKQELTRLPEK